jgi:hypothetical protein
MQTFIQFERKKKHTHTRARACTHTCAHTHTHTHTNLIEITNKMRSCSRIYYYSDVSLIAQHVSGDTPLITRSSKTVIAASGFTYVCGWRQLSWHVFLQFMWLSVCKPRNSVFNVSNICFPLQPIYTVECDEFCYDYIHFI